MDVDNQEDDQGDNDQNVPAPCKCAQVQDSPPIDVDDQDNNHQNVPAPRKCARVQDSPPIDVDDQDENSASTLHQTQSVQSQDSDLPEVVQDVSSKRAHETDEEEVEDNSDDEEAEIVVSKAPNLEKKSTWPKAGDYDEFGKELVLTAANQYHALLASQGAFPNHSMELKLIKKAWKMVNTESGVKPLDLTPSMVKRKPKRRYLWRLCMVFIVVGANGQ